MNDLTAARTLTSVCEGGCICLGEVTIRATRREREGTYMLDVDKLRSRRTGRKHVFAPGSHQTQLRSLGQHDKRSKASELGSYNGSRTPKGGGEGAGH